MLAAVITYVMTLSARKRPTNCTAVAHQSHIRASCLSFLPACRGPGACSGNRVLVFGHSGRLLGRGAGGEECRCRIVRQGGSWPDDGPTGRRRPDSSLV